MKLLLILLFATSLQAQVLLIDGDSAFVVPPTTTVELKVILSATSLGGNPAGVNIRFIAPPGQGSFEGRPSLTVATDSSGKAVARYTVPGQTGHLNVDAVSDLGDGAVASFALTITSMPPIANPATLKSQVRQLLLRNAADGSNLQLVGPYWLETGSLIRPARWAKDKEGGGLWRTEEASWLFWVDDGPSKTWAKPTRYYLIPGLDISRARISGEMWWPLVRPPNQTTWQTLGRATAATGSLLNFPDPQPSAGDTCALFLANSGQLGAALSFSSFERYLRNSSVTRFYNDPLRATGCTKTYLWISAAGDRNGLWLDSWITWKDLGLKLRNLGELIAVIETNQSAQAAKYWNGLGISGLVISSTDDLRQSFMHPFRAGYLVRGLLPALERNSRNFELAAIETQRGELVVASPRPQLQRLTPASPRRIPLDDIDFSSVGGTKVLPIPIGFQSATVSTSDPKVALAVVNGKSFIIRGLSEGTTNLVLTLTDNGITYNGLATIRVGLGSLSLRACLIVAATTQCVGQLSRNIPAVEDEIGGHAFLEIQDETIASIDSKIYTYNRGERNIPIVVRGLKAGRTWLKLRSHDGNIVGDVPVQVAEAPPPLAGVGPSACPNAATYRATFRLSGGDETLFEPFGGTWWGNGITIAFRRIGLDRFEMRSSGATEGQFFALSGTLSPDCSFVGTGQGVAALRLTTAQIRGRISAPQGIFDSMTLDYSIGIDGVFPRPIEYRGTGTLLAGCTYQTNLSEALTFTGGLIPIPVASPALCPWTSEVISGSANLVAGQLGFGPGIVWLQVPENPGPERRIRLQVAGVNLDLLQPAKPEALPDLAAALNAGSLDNIATPGSQILLLGNNLLRPLRAGALPSTTLYWNPAFAVLQLPDRLKPGVNLLESGLSRPLALLVERSAPGIIRADESGIFVTGIDPSLPLYVEVAGQETAVQSIQPAQGGVYRLDLALPSSDISLKTLLVRQAGRGSQRGVFVM